MLIQCDGDVNAGVWGQGICCCGECEYIGGTRGSGIVSSADDVLEVSMMSGV